MLRVSTAKHFIIMKTTLTVGDDGVLTFSEELLKETGWKEGDMLEWIDNHDGSYSLVKVIEEDT